MAEQGKVKKITDEEDFEEHLKTAGDKLVVVDFYADWCGPCKMMAPKVEEMAKELEGIVIFLKVDVDSESDIAEKQEIGALPTFGFFRNGQKVAGFVGANIDRLRDEIEQQMKKDVGANCPKLQQDIKEQVQNQVKY